MGTSATNDLPHSNALVRRGYRNVRRYAGGLLDRGDAGLPLEGTFASPGPRAASAP